MQMTKAAAVAILAFTSSAVAYYGSYDDSYGSVYARDAYADADYDDFSLYARDAGFDFEDLHPRDAYLAGFEDGMLRRRAVNPAGGEATAAKKDELNQKNDLNTQKKDQTAANALSGQVKGLEALLAKDKAKLSQDRKGASAAGAAAGKAGAAADKAALDSINGVKRRSYIPSYLDYEW